MTLKDSLCSCKQYLPLLWTGITEHLLQTRERETPEVLSASLQEQWQGDTRATRSPGTTPNSCPDLHAGPHNRHLPPETISSPADPCTDHKSVMPLMIWLQQLRGLIKLSLLPSITASLFLHRKVLGFLSANNYKTHDPLRAIKNNNKKMSWWMQLHATSPPTTPVPRASANEPLRRNFILFSRCLFIIITSRHNSRLAPSSELAG